jgi:hypothetical protein
MFEFKYYARIEAALEAPVDPQANMAFNIDDLGVDSTARRTRMRLLTGWCWHFCGSCAPFAPT